MNGPDRKWIEEWVASEGFGTQSNLVTKMLADFDTQASEQARAEKWTKRLLELCGRPVEPPDEVDISSMTKLLRELDAERSAEPECEKTVEQILQRCAKCKGAFAIQSIKRQPTDICYECLHPADRPAKACDGNRVACGKSAEDLAEIAWNAMPPEPRNIGPSWKRLVADALHPYLQPVRKVKARIIEDAWEVLLESDGGAESSWIRGPRSKYADHKWHLESIMQAAGCAVEWVE